LSAKTGVQREVSARNLSLDENQMKSQKAELRGMENERRGY
jgi:hypothetical protein